MITDTPHGGSLNDIEFTDDEVIKHYSEHLARGHEKLHNEFLWLRTLPEQVRPLAGRLIGYWEERGKSPATTLILRRESAPSVAKAVLSSALSPGRTAAIVTELARIVTDELYPHRARRMPGSEVWQRYHAARLSVLDDLASRREYAPLCGAHPVRVNGMEYPGLADTVAWLRSEAPKVFGGDHRLGLAHMDSHMDNILAPVSGDVRLILIDPRGEKRGPIHYDVAKQIKSLATPYHAVHYGRYTMAYDGGERCAVDLTVHEDDHVRRCWAAGLSAVMDAMPAYARAEDLSMEQFRRVVLIAKFVHYLSFSWYHAHNPRPDTQRVRAYLAITCALGGRLIEGVTGPDAVTQALLTRP